jgi:hypothetical protein
LVDSRVVDMVLAWIYCPTLFSVAPMDEIPAPVDKLYSSGMVVDYDEVSVVFWVIV